MDDPCQKGFSLYLVSNTCGFEVFKLTEILTALLVVRLEFAFRVDALLRVADLGCLNLEIAILFEICDYSIFSSSFVSFAVGFAFQS